MDARGAIHEQRRTMKAMSKPHEPSTSSLRWRLRDATRQHHDRLEQRLGLMERQLTRPSYRRLLEIMWGYYDPLEDALAHLEWTGTNLSFASRRKALWLAADLLDLGHTAQSLAILSRCVSLPACRSIPQGLGILYVLEGATLGGQLISRRLGPELGISPASAGRFFASYGSATGAMWQSFLASLEQAGTERAAALAIERAALDTFATLDAWLAAAQAQEVFITTSIQPEARAS
ncbi:MAG: biliverdin-producing heme oxygenase [Hyphomicrobium sp.]